MRSTTSEPKAKPLKRPSQARAKFTVQAIFDAYVRIWQRDGWQRITTRAVALETGIAVGTLYDYFPNKTAMHSGYMRYCIESLIAKVDSQVTHAEGLDWQSRLQGLLQILCGVDRSGLPWFHPDMLDLEPSIAELKHQQRAHQELNQMWQRVFQACPDLPRVPDPATIEALHLAVWGGRRYALLLQMDEAYMRQWAKQMEKLCLATIIATQQSLSATDNAGP